MLLLFRVASESLMSQGRFRQMMGGLASGSSNGRYSTRYGQDWITQTFTFDAFLEWIEDTYPKAIWGKCSIQSNRQLNDWDRGIFVIANAMAIIEAGTEQYSKLQGKLKNARRHRYSTTKYVAFIDCYFSPTQQDLYDDIAAHALSPTQAHDSG
jgi:hypothetical protein